MDWERVAEILYEFYSEDKWTWQLSFITCVAEQNGGEG